MACYEKTGKKKNHTSDTWSINGPNGVTWDLEKKIRLKKI